MRTKEINNKVSQRRDNTSILSNQSVQFKDNRNQSATNIQKMANDSIQMKPNNTGLPNQLKSGIERLSGYSMDDVKVHYNSSKPAQLNAHAYAQGTDIHVASGQEKHLPHEAWHVVQQKQGRVQPTRQLKGKVNINDDAGLEREADVMGAKALQMKCKKCEKEGKSRKTQSNTIQRALVSNACNAPRVGNALTLGTFIHGIIENNYLQQGNPGVNQTRVVEKPTTGGNYRADLGTESTVTGNLVRQGEIKPDNAAGLAAGIASIANVAADNGVAGAPQINMAAWAAGFAEPLGFGTALTIDLRQAPGYNGLYLYDCH